MTLHYEPAQIIKEFERESNNKKLTMNKGDRAEGRRLAIKSGTLKGEREKRRRLIQRASD